MTWCMNYLLFCMAFSAIPIWHVMAGVNNDPNNITAWYIVCWILLAIFVFNLFRKPSSVVK